MTQTILALHDKSYPITIMLVLTVLVIVGIETVYVKRKAC